MELLTRQSLLQQQTPEIDDPKIIQAEEASARERLQDLEQELNDGAQAAREELSTQDAEAIQQALITCRQHYRTTNEQRQSLQKQLEQQQTLLKGQQQQQQALQLQREALTAEIRSLDQQRLALIRDHGDGERIDADLRQLEEQIGNLQTQLNALPKADRANSGADAAIDRRLKAAQQQLNNCRNACRA